ncbi:hypothetical protein EGJ27_01105 [Pseudomonas sp. v388]|nr:hypothetical protein EGJ27_01105 [Pseudomonas sp. v388]
MSDMESRIVAPLDALRTQLQQAESVLKTLDTELAGITCDPAEPRSIKLAISQIIEAIDTRFEHFKSNPVLGPLAEKLKAQYVENIRSQVAEAAASQR